MRYTAHQPIIRPTDNAYKKTSEEQSVSEQIPTDFPGFYNFSHPLHRFDEPRSLLPGPYCGSFDGDHYLGPSACVSLQVDMSQMVSGYSAFGFGVTGPVIMILPSIIFLALVLIWIGFLVGFYRARRGTFRGKLPNLNSPRSYSQWAYERNTSIFTFILIFAGLTFFIFGVSGGVELEFQHAKIVTSTPGLALILIGYLFWTRRYYPNKNRNNEGIHYNSE